MTPETFNERLEAAGLSQAAFARIVHMTPMTVNAWSTGRRPVPPWVDSWLGFYITARDLEDDRLTSSVYAV